jgi:DNA primase
MSVVDDVKQKIDIVDVISQYTTLKKAGRNYKALCPFHNEKTPSFIVSPDQGTWHCFGACNTGGDVFAFLMKRENIDFPEALRRLALRAGVEIVHETPGEDIHRKKLREILATAAAHYHYLLKNNSNAQFARDYLAKRFITPETIEQFELGYSLDDWHAMESYLVGKGFTVADVESAGLSILRDGGGHYDRFRGRLMFPIRNRSGEVIGFGARTLTGEEPKYLNSPQTPMFDKSGTLYGLDLAKDTIRAQNLAVIVEGYMDVIGAHQGGFKNVVASLGTALTEKQLGLLKRLTNRYALALDPDAAGEEATKRGLEVARQALDRKTVPVPMGAGLIAFEQRLEAELLVIAMPEGKDPDELIHDNPAEWQRLTEHPEPLVDFQFRVMTQDLDLKLARDKSIAVKRLVPIIQEVGDSVQRAHYTQQLARLVQVPEQTIAQQISGVTVKRVAPRVSTQKTETIIAPRAESKLEEYLLTLLVHSPEHVRRISFIETDDFSQSDHRALFVSILAETSQSNVFDRETFRESLDPELKTLFDQLAAQTHVLSEFEKPDLMREIQTVAYRIRLQHDKAELAQVEVVLRDRDEERIAADEAVLHERVGLLSKRIIDSQKALSARSLLKPSATNMGR